MTLPDFLEPDVVMVLHDQALREYGGVQGLRGDDVLRSALARPVDRLGYDDADVCDLFDLAAAYAFGLAWNHPFDDGNERTAWGCCVLFLKLNGCELSVAAPEAVERMVRLASGAIGESDFAIWLRQQRRE